MNAAKEYAESQTKNEGEAMRTRIEQAWLAGWKARGEGDADTVARQGRPYQEGCVELNLCERLEKAIRSHDSEAESARGGEA